jgi:diguanylate cyclase (GGDEF)-like protein/PAS domain S-box-containing protein
MSEKDGRLDEVFKMTNNTVDHRERERWRLFFNARCTVLIVLGAISITPFVDVEPEITFVLLLFALPLNLVFREWVDWIRAHAWAIVLVDSILLGLGIFIDPNTATGAGVLMMASTSVTATGGWRPTVAAALGGAPFLGAAMVFHSVDNSAIIIVTYLSTASSMAYFISVMALSERLERQRRYDLINGLDAVVWEAHPYPFVDAQVSGRVDDLLGLSIDDVSGPGALLGQLPAFDRSTVVSRSHALIDDGEDHELVYRLTTADGSLRHVRDRVRVVTNANGKPLTARGIITDITDEVQIRASNRNLAELVERVPVGLVIAQIETIDGTTIFTTLSVNPAYEELTGLGATVLVSDSVDNPITGPGQIDVRRILLEVVESGETRRIEEACDLQMDGDRTLSLEAFPISDELIGMNVVDVTGSVTAADRLRYQALHDALTGLPNRTLLEDRLRHALDSAGRTHKSVCLLMLDLNRFKDVNDTLGHDQGDRLLRAVAIRIQSVVRSVDTVARFGGDEFAVLLTDDVSPQRAMRAAERVLACFDEPIEIDGMSLQTSASLGMALCPDHGDSADTLRKNADIAMYVAKRRGGGIAVYDPERDQPSVHRQTLVSELHEAITEDKLEIYYQPAINLDTGQVNNVEAFLRWNHPERGLLGPEEFIDLAEVSGLIRPLTRWALGRAITDIAKLNAAGHPIGVSINVSIRNLYESVLVDEVQSLIETAGLPRERLTVELTETQIMDDPVLTHNALSRLGELGVRSAVDDFGTGHSSLSTLQSLPVSEVKIDKAFVQGMGAGDEAATAIVRSMISLAHILKLDVVAEGVETTETLAQLSLFGCDRAQGYFFAKPMAFAELDRYLSNPTVSEKPKQHRPLTPPRVIAHG